MISGVRRAGLVFLAASGLLVGTWALVWPGGFYSTFPGFGLDWVAASGPRNDHFVTDVGSAYLALAAAAVLALAWADRRSAQMAGAVWTVFSAPHLGYHVLHPGELGDLAQVLQLVALASNLGVAVWLMLPIKEGRPA